MCLTPEVNIFFLSNLFQMKNNKGLRSGRTTCLLIHLDTEKNRRIETQLLTGLCPSDYRLQCIQV